MKLNALLLVLIFFCSCYGYLYSQPPVQEVPDWPEEKIITVPGWDTISQDTIPADYVIIVDDCLPLFKGGLKALVRFLRREVHYPEEALQKRIEGNVYVQFLVDKNGKVSDANVLKGLGYGCDEKALRIVGEMPAWIPCERAGKKVPMKYVLPIPFKLTR